jgi:two-component system phosphate regulon response regulator OmpR
MDPLLKIALVEDNDDLRDLLARDISRAGYEVHTAECAEDLDDLVSHTLIDLLILDLTLPGEDGLSIARRYKQANPDTYIIMLTARGREQDRIEGYEAGADVYLTKPISSSELMAAIGSVSRRLSKRQDLIDIVLNVRAMTLTGLKTIALNRQEVVMLKALNESPNGNLAYFRLLELHGELEINESAKAALEVRVVRLRKKLAEAGIEGKTIRAIRGEGYHLLSRIKVI